MDVNCNSITSKENSTWWKTDHTTQSSTWTQPLWTSPACSAQSIPLPSSPSATLEGNLESGFMYYNVHAAKRYVLIVISFLNCGNVYHNLLIFVQTETTSSVMELNGASSVTFWTPLSTEMNGTLDTTLDTILDTTLDMSPDLWGSHSNAGQPVGGVANAMSLETPGLSPSSTLDVLTNGCGLFDNGECL